ncbi:MAG: arsenic efflux protein, partial [Oscillospiraceae bacterium]|nr:arsenic efflux protein [Oscillospiraceae bacterium]
MLDALIDTILDGLKLLPFLFVAYLAIELIEDRAEEKTVALIHSAGRWGPVIGAGLGVVPQCGFSAAVSNLYAGGLITRGTLLAVFLSTSDEMLPILISQRAPAAFILKVLSYKLLCGILVGVIVDTLELRFERARRKSLHELCEQEDCRCEDGVLRSALRHTMKIFIFIFIVSFLMNVFVGLVGEERLGSLILNRPVAGELLAGLIGLIPNCAASVVLTSLYLQGGVSAGAMVSGLLVSSGVGLLVLVRMNKNWRDNLITLGVL